jgi:hypothetical protein
MDFKLVLEKILAEFEKSNVHYALMGGFAMGLWGGSRSTIDLDFLVYRDDMERVHRVITDMGYERHQHTENVSQYDSPLHKLGGVDFIHAFREASIEMIERAKTVEIFGGTFKIKTLIPEDIIGLKLQAIYNNPEREVIDRPDIEALISGHGKEMDWSLLERYFKLFEMEDWYQRLREVRKL